MTDDRKTTDEPPIAPGWPATTRRPPSEGSRPSGRPTTRARTVTSRWGRERRARGRGMGRAERRHGRIRRAMGSAGAGGPTGATNSTLDGDDATAGADRLRAHRVRDGLRGRSGGALEGLIGRLEV